MVQGGEQTVVLGAQPGQRLFLAGAEPVGGGGFGQGEEEVAMPPDESVLLAEFGEALAPVVADRLQQPATRQPLPFDGQDDGLCHQPLKKIQHLVAGEAVARADPFGRVQGEAAVEDRQPVPQQPLGRRAQFVAPVDRRAQSALPRKRGPAATRKQREAVLQPVRHLPHTECPQP
ncbi:hypothetical protein ACOT81_05465 [Streptomyces sp. WI04-05B]|uniref:hypothetical protein n=1 Tax=Streptomyces echiniscabiei TaxID=3028708 RepID=UPI003B9C6858